MKAREKLRNLHQIPEDLVLLTVNEVAELLGATTRQIRNEMDSGDLPGSWTPDGHQISLWNLRRYLAGETRLVAVPQVAEQLGMPLWRVDKLVKAGKLHSPNSTHVTLRSLKAYTDGRPLPRSAEHLVALADRGWLTAPVAGWPAPGPWPASEPATLYGGESWQREAWSGFIRAVYGVLAGSVERAVVRLPPRVLAFETTPHSVKVLATAIYEAGGDATPKGFSPAVEHTTDGRQWRLFRLPKTVQPINVLPVFSLEPWPGVKLHHQNHGYIPLPQAGPTAEFVLRDLRGGFPPLQLAEISPDDIPRLPPAWIDALLIASGA